MYTMEWSLLADWKDALRSGEYEQCRYKLVTEDAYCCLGVLSDLFLCHGKHTLYGYSGWNRYPAYNRLISFDLEMTATNLNDTQQLTFPQIADWLDDNVRAVEK